MLPSSVPSGEVNAQSDGLGAAPGVARPDDRPDDFLLPKVPDRLDQLLDTTWTMGLRARMELAKSDSPCSVEAHKTPVYQIWDRGVVRFGL